MGSVQGHSDNAGLTSLTLPSLPSQSTLPVYPPSLPSQSTCVEFARTDRGGDVGAVPVTSVPGVSNQLPALVTLNHTPVVGGVLLVDVVPAEEARGTVLVDE